jgi:hypothetical protein
MKLKQRIPRHIYERGTSGLGEPDFYAGPTIAGKEPQKGPEASGQDDDLRAEMQKMKEEVAREASDQPSVLSRIVSLFRGRRRVRQATP